jgi:hypothetical protein
MKKTIFAALGLICLAVSANAQNSADNPSIERRAVEAVTWGMPAVNYDLMYQEMLKLGGRPNQIVYWSRLPDWKNQTLTPNPDVIYLMPFFNTKDAGPMVLEIPPADDGVINGTIMDAWQVPLEDVGPAGVDKGKGGKYLILPPATMARHRTATLLSRQRIIRATRCSAPFSEAAAMPTSPRPSTTASASSSIPCRRRRIRRRRHSSMRSTAFTTPPFRTTCVSSSRSTASCRLSRGFRATS